MYLLPLYTVSTMTVTDSPFNDDLLHKNYDRIMTSVNLVFCLFSALRFVIFTQYEMTTSIILSHISSWHSLIVAAVGGFV
jgi:hypothetical protein